MLNTIVHNRLNDNISEVAGIPKDWNRSNYNYQEKAIVAMKDPIQKQFKNLNCSSFV